MNIISKLLNATWYESVRRRTARAALGAAGAASEAVWARSLTGAAIQTDGNVR